MARRNEGLFDILLALPWWASVIASGTCYVFLAYLAPNLFAGNQILSTLSQAFSDNAGFFSALLLIPGFFSFFRQLASKQRLDSQRSLETIRALSWHEFEQLIAEYYRRKGFQVLENTTKGADGGIDIRLMKEGRHLVQCKHYRAQKVGVAVVREMYGVLIDDGAKTMTIVTSGYFTNDAIQFAKGKPVSLVTGPMLLDMIKPVQKKSVHAAPATNFTSSSVCPRCGSRLVLRTAKKGKHRGLSFYGCSNFPKCRYTKGH